MKDRLWSVPARRPAYALTTQKRSHHSRLMSRSQDEANAFALVLEEESSPSKLDAAIPF